MAVNNRTILATRGALAGLSRTEIFAFHNMVASGPAVDSRAR